MKGETYREREEMERGERQLGGVSEREASRHAGWEGEKRLTHSLRQLKCI